MAGKPVSSLERQIAGLPIDVRDRVLERASILFDSGHTWEEADRLAYDLETKKASPGVARAEPVDGAPSEKSASSTKG